MCLNIVTLKLLLLGPSLNSSYLNLMMQNLYIANVRKVVVAGLAPIGCAPYYLWQYRSRNGKCVQMINDMITEFNFAVRYMVDGLNQKLQDADIIFCDIFEGSMDIIKNHDRFGEIVFNFLCCISLYI